MFLKSQKIWEFKAHDSLFQQQQKERTFAKNGKFAQRAHPGF
jgi:hypothetical protein